MANFKTKARTGSPSPLVRPRPANNGDFVAFYTDDDSFSAHIHRDVLEFIRRASLKAAPDEAIGMLAGRTCLDPARGPYTLVTVADGARDDEVEASPSHVHISADGNASLRLRLEATHPDREIVGWYHSHPRYPAQFSHVDIAEQSTWNDPHHIGIVFSGTERNEPFGVYRGPAAIRLLRRSAESWSKVSPNTAFTAKRVAGEQATTERAAADKPPLPMVVHPPTSRVPSVSRRLFGRLRVALPRLLAVLTVFGLGAGLLWLHFRVRAIESALGSAKGLVTGSPAQSPPAAAQPQPQQPTPTTGTTAGASAAPEADTGAGSRTASTEEAAAAPTAKRPTKKTTRPKARRADRAGRREARVNKPKNSNQ